jgi:hypothetical protein
MKLKTAKAMPAPKKPAKTIVEEVDAVEEATELFDKKPVKTIFKVEAFVAPRQVAAKKEWMQKFFTYFHPSLEATVEVVE